MDSVVIGYFNFKHLILTSNRGKIEVENEEEEGRAEGKAEGEAKGTNLMAKLAALLVKDGKYDAIVRASMDEEYRNSLMKEYQLA